MPSPSTPDHPHTMLIPDHRPHDDFGGLARDLPALTDRRRALRWMGGLGLAGVLAACSGDDDATSAPSSSPPSTDDGSGTTITGGDAAPTSAASDDTAPSVAGASDDVIEASPGAEIPDETAGPFPADGTNGPNVLDIEGVVRRDLTTSIGDLSGTAVGVPTTLQLTVVDASTGEPLPGAALYLWHCTADGRYTVYEVEDQNYLRGVQAADAAGRMTFTTVFPGCYRGRWPHAHFEIYASVDDAASGANPIKISQLALPQADCETVYANPDYGDSQANLGELSLSTDGVFRDGWDEQLATVAGSLDQGFTASLLVRV